MTFYYTLFFVIIVLHCNLYLIPNAAYLLKKINKM